MLNKIKYQNPHFRQKLQQARSYRREIKKIPSGFVEFFLAFLHLNTFLGKTAAGIGLLLIIYIVYAPNFLTIKTIEIHGSAEPVQATVLKSINEYLISNPLRPQRNFLLLSKNGLANFLTTKNYYVEKVLKIEKKFPDKIIVEIEERYDKFLLKTPENVYVLTDDGLVSRELKNETADPPTTSPPTNLIPLSVKENRAFTKTQAAADAAYFEHLNRIINGINQSLATQVTEIRLENFARSDLEVETQKGFVVKFNITSDLDKVFKQLKPLLRDVGEARISAIKYIDMRIKDRGYVCFKDAACAVETQPKWASTTPDQIN